jgi:hypothetical protein
VLFAVPQASLGTGHQRQVFRPPLIRFAVNVPRRGEQVPVTPQSTAEGRCFG